ncbi:MAG TPA: metallophosphoesterase [Campylobacterales bacterium]|nr:metallophosphoesterase [Campylobacterales bacterium]HIP59904.1 metallophosphoesterase [Campylobacterales bacterium]
MFETKGFFPTPQTIEVPIERLPLALEGLSILHLSDLHINKKTTIEKMEQLINSSNQLSPDIIVITGDIIDTKPKHIKEKLKLLKGLKANTFYISGNHDLFYGLDELVSILEETHITFIDNQLVNLQYHGHSYSIAGLGDRFSKFFGRKRDIEKITQQIREKNPLIFLAHQPKDYTIALQCGAILFLAGHTHGGQIFPFHYLVKLVQPFLAGLHFKKGMSIYISRGLGSWGVDFRFLAPSEISLLKLKGS